MNVVPITFCFDENLLVPAGVCITSLLENAKETTFYDIFILHSDTCNLAESPIHKLSQIYTNCRITCRTVGNVFKGAYEIRSITEAAYYRLLIPTLIPEYDKIIYADVDIIFRDDLWECYDKVDLTDSYLAAVDVASAVRPEILSYKELLGISSHAGYFNSGFLIFNSSLIRQDELTDVFLELSKKKFKYQDQDILNIACADRVKYLSPECNLQIIIVELFLSSFESLKQCFSAEEILIAIKNGIVHYNGAKPWKGLCYNQDIWWSYYRKSIFFDEKYANAYYESLVNYTDSWSLIKRFKHLVRYFIH